MDGILLIDKPEGWTSFDVVAKVRGILKRAGNGKPKIGHTGTLDPLASGLLVLVLGSYTKRAQEFTTLSKVYQATIMLGVTSTTGDNEGQKTVVSVVRPTFGDIQNVLNRFKGDILQRPHAFSAIKIHGQRAYELSRKGEIVTLPERPITIYALMIEDYNYPELQITANVSSGTYIRSLAEDLGDALEVGAYLTSLRRTSVGEYELKDALKIEALTAESIYRSLKVI